MASIVPSEDEICQVIDFAGLDPVDDRNMVIAALKQNNNNVETVVMRYFDNASSFREHFTRLWDDSMFSGDRDATDSRAGTSVHVETSDQNFVPTSATPPIETQAQVAPSRPPSRSGDRSPLGRMVDWLAGDAPGTALSEPGEEVADLGAGSGVPNSHAQEDQDMARALRESAQEAGVAVPAQESGVVDNSTTQPHFGPANRGDYDQDTWGMVQVKNSQAKARDAPAPSLRKRTDGAPAFLVQGQNNPNDHQLGALLTILHQIPLARNILLDCGTPAPSYGHNSAWWNGQEILPAHVLAQLHSEELDWGDRRGARPVLEEELHRLMAFLDSTERSHATVGVLNDLLPYPGVAPERQLFETLGEDNRDKLTPLYHIASLAHIRGNATDDEEARFAILEMDHSQEEYAGIKTLYEAVDHIMWSDVLSWDQMLAESKMAMFKDMGEMFAVKVVNHGPVDGFEVPEVLYPERWLASRKDEARRIQSAYCKAKRALSAFNSDAKTRRNSATWAGAKMSIKTKELWSTYKEYLESKAKFEQVEAYGFDPNKYPVYRAAPDVMDSALKGPHDEATEVVEWADDMFTALQDQVNQVQAGEEQAKSKLRFLGKLLTDPDKPGRPQPMTCKKYMLRGVATSPDTVYVCSRAEPDLIELEDTPKSRDQWWRLAYAPNDEHKPVRAEKIEVERVLRDMWQETKTPILVYATEDAMSAPPTSLAGPLAQFVKAENKAFRQELNQEKAESTQHDTRQPMSPSKRKHRADSVDSMDSNRASLGSFVDGESSDPFADFGTEMADLTVERQTGHAGGGPRWTPPGTDDQSEMEAAFIGDSGREDGSKALTPDTSEVKCHEMQERARSPLLSRQSNASGDASPPDAMDMDMAHH